MLALGIYSFIPLINGAEFAGDYYQRAVMALDAGCDMLLVCNHPEAVKEIIDQWDYETDLYH
jgi:beta-N-acetylhexosaminidase